MISSKIAAVSTTADKIVTDVAAVKPGEQVLILADYESYDMVLDALTAAVTRVGAHPSTVVVSPREIAGHAFPPIVYGAISAADVVLGVADSDIIHSMIWAPGGKIRAEEERRWRLVEMSSATPAMMTRPGASADLDEIARITHALHDTITGASHIRIVTELGTDIAGKIGSGADGSLGIGMNLGRAHEVGSWCCFPDGEVFILAQGSSGTWPGDTEGTVVFDTSMHMLGALQEPIRCTVQAGKVTEITGGWQAQELRRILDEVPDSNNIIELGSFATNPLATPHGESMFEDRKSLGTVHVAIGNTYNKMYEENGAYRPFVHLDGVISKATVSIDDRTVMEAGTPLWMDR